MQFFPWIFTLFLFILAGNMLGLIPGAFTFTSHIIVTFFMAICVWLAVTAVGFCMHGLGFLKFFVPHGAPPAMYPLLVPIEILSYCVRPVSLSIRLFVNMMAGHTMLKVFAGFIIALGLFGDLSAGGDRGAVRLRDRGRLPAGLHLHRADLHLPARRDPHALSAGRRRRTACLNQPRTPPREERRWNSKLPR